MVHHNSKFVTALVSLLFLFATAAITPALALDNDSGSYAATTETSFSLGWCGWIEKANTPAAGGYGEAVVGTGNNIYVARCYNINDAPAFWRYCWESNSWILMNTSGLPTGAFRNGAALAWAGDEYIYALLGARYKSDDDNRSLFYRYSITKDIWEQRANTPHAQGAGDAITWSGYDGYVYAIAGNKDRKSMFGCYNISTNTWTELPLNPDWTSTDDGASLAWTGGEYIYALQGEWEEKNPNQNFTRYHIPTKTWGDLSPIPENENESEGVGDGASLLWVSEYPAYIFALGGGSCLEELGYNFYQYNILSNDWKQLELLPCPVGNYVGNRLGFANGHIYYWQGTPENASKWICNGSAFYMFKFESSSLSIFDTGSGTYPSIFGVHYGTIKPSQMIVANKLYTYPCTGTGGHTEYIKIGNATWNESAHWKGYKSGDYHYITFAAPFTLETGKIYYYSIRTGSYPQIIHNQTLTTENGTITCAEFIDANGKRYNNWIPAIRLE